jgi:PTH1 family peptidyl-tRNA hydrolase
MNLSGKSVQAVMNFFKIPLEDLVVIHDDIDLPLGTVRYKIGGSPGGHNGLKSIDATVGREYLRVRLGVGKPPHKGQVADYVLSPFLPEEEPTVERIVAFAAEVCLKIPALSLNELKSRYSLKAEKSDET